MLRSLAKTGLEIAPLVFGGNVLGWTIDEKTSFQVLDAFLDHGFNAIDTADIYSAWASGNKGGESETIVGNWLKARRGMRDHLSRVFARGGRCDRKIFLQVSSSYAFASGVGRPCCFGPVAAQCGFGGYEGIADLPAKIASRPTGAKSTKAAPSPPAGFCLLTSATLTTRG